MKKDEKMYKKNLKTFENDLALIKDAENKEIE